MASFNLLDEAWIPVSIDGQRLELSLSDSLISAHEIDEMGNQSPLVTVAVHRLMLAVLHRVFGPANLEEWANLWRRGSWDPDRLVEYFDKLHSRFDLFDEEAPFYQVPKLEDEKWTPIDRLAIEHASGNNPTLFDHSVEDAPIPVSAARAAQLLVATQAFAIPGGNSKPFNFSDGPLRKGFVVMVVGNTLFETLALNLMTYSGDRPLPKLGNDLPAWEQSDNRSPDKTGNVPNGYVDYLTWQSRRIYLEPIVSGNSETYVQRCQFLQNLKLADEVLDPFKAFIRQEEAGFIARELDPSRAIWRDYHTLIPGTDVSEPPQILRWLGRIHNLRESGQIDADATYRLDVLGLVPPQKVKGKPRHAASIVGWRHERLPIPLTYLSTPELARQLHYCILLTENVAAALSTSMNTLAKLLLFPEAELKNEGRKPGKEDWKDIQQAAKGFQADLSFWANLDVPFSNLMIRLARPDDREVDDFGNVEYGVKAVLDWKEELMRSVTQAFDEVCDDLGNSGRALRAAVNAKRTLCKNLPDLRKESNANE